MRPIATTTYHRFARSYGIPVTSHGQPRSISFLQKAIYAREQRLVATGKMKKVGLYFNVPGH
jgi:hypothetical protein